MPERKRAYPQARYWMLTIAYTEWKVCEHLPERVEWLKGQLEVGEQGFEHWQLVVGFATKVRLAAVKKAFGPTCHAEPTRSEAADDYVWKDETSVYGSRFELGCKAIRRGNSVDWQRILTCAKSGNIEEIPPDIVVRCYNQISRIGTDFAQPVGIEREILVYWGKTGTGKSRRAWDEGGLDSYPKDPRSKFWNGYRGQQHVIIDEFRGGIEISHMLRWLDRYPVIVDIKGGGTVLKAKKIWITSNLHPKDWFPNLDSDTLDALLRRLTITHFLTNELT